MPGALFPVSPSPDADDDTSDTSPSKQRHVRFDGTSPSNPVDLTDDEPGPSQRRKISSTPTKVQAQPITNCSPSIRTAVSRFKTKEADSSLLLPKSPSVSNSSPPRPPPSPSAKAKGKAPVRSRPDPFSFEEHESEPIRKRPREEDISLDDQDKRRIRALEEEVEQLRREVRALCIHRYCKIY
ncbi:hypothetical protein FA15DRAFT_91061 [Coprinopsis marcescibilis]|uniref:Uncharacterized protein n=1 Tax=Coprinopsis marcescibilis TaxID=230819 RepID=A0A5C3L621_COPMA|nr:hypothetical protein FA15DRAFT_91061 [Coprinopsis marcescibilis]